MFNSRSDVISTLQKNFLDWFWGYIYPYTVYPRRYAPSWKFAVRCMLYRLCYAYLEKSDSVSRCVFTRRITRPNFIPIRSETTDLGFLDSVLLTTRRRRRWVAVSSRSKNCSRTMCYIITLYAGSSRVVKILDYFFRVTRIIEYMGTALKSQPAAIQY